MLPRAWKALAEPGGICLSGPARDTLSNKLDDGLLKIAGTKSSRILTAQFEFGGGPPRARTDAETKNRAEGGA